MFDAAIPVWFFDSCFPLLVLSGQPERKADILALLGDRSRNISLRVRTDNEPFSEDSHRGQSLAQRPSGEVEQVGGAFQAPNSSERNRHRRRGRSSQGTGNHWESGGGDQGTRNHSAGGFVGGGEASIRRFGVKVIRTLGLWPRFLGLAFRNGNPQPHVLDPSWNLLTDNPKTAPVPRLFIKLVLIFVFSCRVSSVLDYSSIQRVLGCDFLRYQLRSLTKSWE